MTLLRSHSATGLLNIDLSAIARNYQLLRAQCGPACKTAAVVKADSYGLGAAKIAPVLYEAGARFFYAATPEEGAALREVLAEKPANIAVLNGYIPGWGATYQEHQLIPCLCSPEQLHAFQSEMPAEHPLIIHFDTGMNRLGFSQTECEGLHVQGLHIAGWMSHFACADEAGHAMNNAQSQEMKQRLNIVQRWRTDEQFISFCNSSGVFNCAGDHYSQTRPGMALYGLNPTLDKPNPMQPVISLKLPVLQIRTPQESESIGYGANYKVTKPDMVTATLGGGYADGIFRNLSNKGFLCWKSYKLPVCGRVSMDLLAVDITHVPERERPCPGDMIEILGTNQSADDLAAQAGTIGYEILTSLGRRYKRLYTGA